MKKSQQLPGVQDLVATTQVTEAQNLKNQGFAQMQDCTKTKGNQKKKASIQKIEGIIPPKKQIRKTNNRGGRGGFRGGQMARGKSRGGFSKSAKTPSTRKYNAKAKKNKVVPEGQDEEYAKSGATLPSTNQNTDQPEKAKAKGKRGGPVQTAPLSRNPKSNKISKGKNKVSTPKTKRSYIKKTKKLETNLPPIESVKLDNKELEVQNQEVVPEAPVEEEQQPERVTLGGHLSQLTSINQYFNNKKPSNKIIYNDSNFNNKKKVDQKSSLEAEIIAKLQAIKDGKIKISGSEQYNTLKQQLNLQNSSLTNLDLTSLSENDMLAILKQLQLFQQMHLKKLHDKDEQEILQTQERYIPLKEVGKGTFGSVIKAIDTREVQPKNIMKLIQANSMQKDTSNPYQDPQNYVAIKKLFYDRRYEQRELSTLNEIKSKGLCSNIIEVKDQYFRHEPADEAEKRKGVLQKEYLFIVTDFQPYTISDLRVMPSTYLMDTTFDYTTNSVRNYCLESIKQVMLGVFQGLRDLHSIGITHRDIKLCNILIDNNQYPVRKVKICDFGSSKKLVSDPNDQSTQSISYIGTRSFRAPELLVGNRFYDTKIDIWSAGVVFLKLIFKYLNKKVYMFDVKDTKSLSKVIVDFIGQPTDQELKEMQAANTIMSQQKQGISNEELLKKRFKKFDAFMGDKIPLDCIDLLHKLFELSPVRRISAADALKHSYFTSIDKDYMNKSSVHTKQSNVNRTTETTSPCTINNMFFFNKKIN